MDDRTLAEIFQRPLSVHAQRPFAATAACDDLEGPCEEGPPAEVHASSERDGSPIPRWVNPHVLARSARPGYGDFPTPPEAVEEWVGTVQGLGVASVLCLLSRKELRNLYSLVPGGLLAAYRRAGLTVGHVPLRDPVDGDWRQVSGARGAILAAFQALPKPVLIHCRHGIGRTGRAVEFVRAYYAGLDAEGDL